MRKMNPLWDSGGGEFSDDNVANAFYYLYDQGEWYESKTSESSFALPAPSIEMFAASLNMAFSEDGNGIEMTYYISGESYWYTYLKEGSDVGISATLPVTLAALQKVFVRDRQLVYVSFVTCDQAGK